MVAKISFSVESPRGSRELSVSYERAGSGEPLLLLHGIGHHRQAWDPVIGILAAEREVIAVDLPGFGVSPALPDGVRYDLAAVGGALATLCEALDIERPHVAGNSLGGLLALELGREKLVRSVTALSPAGFWTEGERLFAFGTLRAMRLGAQSLSLPMIEWLARSAAGRAALTSTIYAKPGRRSPEAVVAETLALRGATGFHETLLAGRRRPVHRRHPRCARHHRLGHPRPAAVPPAGCPRQAGHPRRPARPAARMRPCADERRPRSRRPRPAGRQPLTRARRRPSRAPRPLPPALRPPPGRDRTFRCPRAAR